MAQIGLIGLGVMGANLALNMAEKGFTVAVYNRTAEKTDAFMAEAGPLAARLVPCKSQAELVAAIEPPRPVVLMVPAGSAVDQQADILAGDLAKGDIIIDCGNANFRDTRRRVPAYAARGFGFLGVGVSGGEEGARHGPAVMAGGAPSDWARVQTIFDAISAKFEGEPCCALCGPDGAGHFVKTIHNGIEYADMQMIAEIYGILRDGLGLAPAEMADIFARWNEGPLKSYLIEITAEVLRAKDSQTGKPLVEVILDAAGQKGTGRWAVIEAQDLGVPATVIEAAVAARNISALKSERMAAAAYFGSPPAAAGNRFGSHLGSRAETVAALGDALLAGKIAAYAQGFAVMGEASVTWKWDLPLATVARIWRAGCIIRSVFLDDIARAYGASADVPNLMMIKPFSDHLKRTHMNLRKVVATAIVQGVAVPALSTALAYFDMYRAARSTADLIQGQRDFFGRHGFKRTDRAGDGFHGPWAD